MMNVDLLNDDMTCTNCLMPVDTGARTLIAATRKPQIWWWGALALAIIMLLVALLGLAYEQARNQAAADVGNLNHILETRLQGIFDGAQANLLNIASRMDEDLLRTATTPPSERWQLRALNRRFPQVVHYDVLTTDGRFLFGSDGKPDNPTQDQLGFRATLAVHSPSPNTPAMLDHDNASQLLNMAVPIFNGQQHTGWIVGELPLKQILEIISEVDVGAHGVITLRRADVPTIVLRVPPPAKMASSYQADMIDDLIAAGHQKGILITNSRVDSVKRVYSFERVGSFSLILVTGFAAEDYLLNWKYTVLAASTVCGGLFLLIISLTVRLQANRIRRQQMLDELSHSAFHDELTELPNRRYLLQRVNNAISKCGRGQKLALLYVDLDNFKNINDSLGHVEGDLILQRLAQRLVSLKPLVDTVARLSGDDFLVLVENDDPDQVAELVARMLNVLQEPLIIKGQPLSISASVGIALHTKHGFDFGSLLKAADMALAQAKLNGRNTWVFYETQMGARELRLHYVQTELRQAFLHQELDVHYQPQIELSTGKVVGAEALLRWQHPGEGAIPPSEFIPVAESTGMIIPISQWLLGKVCRQAVAWQASGFGELSVAMNCSAVQFRQGDLVEDVRVALHESGLKAHLLELEITESILIGHSERAIETINALKALGVRMSLDDFGTGYSSMAYLKRFAVDKLKIDQSFVRGMTSNPQDAAIIKAMIALGHSFGMRVIAEGVEELAALDALTNKGCDEAQGYFYSKALPPMAFELFMQARIESAFLAENWV
jgi:diguanylate cyclase (GGDEF)-like protein